MPEHTLVDRIKQPREILVPRYVPLPSDAVRETGLRLDAKQERGLEAYNRMQELQRTLLSKTIPVEARQREVSGLIEDIEGNISNYAKSGDFIDAYPAIVSAANTLQSRLHPYTQEYETYAKAAESARELMEKGEFEAADQYVAIQKQLDAIERDPTQRFKPGIIAPRFDTNKALADFAKEYDPEGGVQFSPDGRFIIKSKTLDVNAFKQALTQFISSQPGFQRNLANDIEYQMYRQIPTQEALNQKVREINKYFDDESIDIVNTQGIPEEEVDRALDEIDKARTRLNENPERFFRQEIEKSIVNNLIDPYATRASRSGTGITDMVTNQYSLEATRHFYDKEMEDIRQSNRLQLKRLEESSGSGNVQYSPGMSFKEGHGNYNDLINQYNKASASNTDESKAKAGILEYKLEEVKSSAFNDLGNQLGLTRQEYDEIEAYFNDFKSKARPKSLSLGMPAGRISVDDQSSIIYREDIREIENKFGEGKGRLFERARKMIKDYVDSGHGYTDTIITPAEDLSDFKKRLEFTDPGNWVVTAGNIDEDQMRKLWAENDFRPIGHSTETGEVEVLLPDNRKIRIAPIYDVPGDFTEFTLKNMGPHGRSVQQQREWRRMPLSTTPIDISSPEGGGYRIVPEGHKIETVAKKGGRVMIVDGRNLGIRDVFQFADKLKDESMVYQIAHRASEVSNGSLTPQEVVQGGNNSLPSNKQAIFDNLDKEGFVFRKNDNAFAGISAIESIIMGEE